MTPASWHKWFSATVLVNKDDKVQSKILLNHYPEWIELEIPEPALHIFCLKLLPLCFNMSKISEHSWIYYDMKVIEVFSYSWCLNVHISKYKSV